MSTAWNECLSLFLPVVLGWSPPRLTSAHPTLQASEAGPPPPPVSQLVVVTGPQMFTKGLALRLLSSGTQILKGARPVFLLPGLRDPFPSGFFLGASSCGEQVSGWGQQGTAG